MAKERYIKVGKYRQKYNDLLNASLPIDDIYRSEGLFVHIKKRHPGCIKYLDRISDILENPDYIGTNPKEPDSVEFIKKYNKNLLIAVKLDSKHDYLYVATLYEISDSKIERQLNSGRLIKM